MEKKDEDCILINGYRIKLAKLTDEKLDALVTKADELVQTYEKQLKVNAEMTDAIRRQLQNAKQELEGWRTLRVVYRARRALLEKEVEDGKDQA